jgi:hypothetical protein
MQTHLVTYRHAGAEWVLEIKADSEQDAMARLSRLAFASYAGVLVAKVPVSLGPVAKVLARIRNAAISILS